MFHKSKDAINIYKLIDIDASNISTGQMSNYIKYLSSYNRLNHIGYRPENIKDKVLRFVIYSRYKDNKSKLYFDDRCPAMVENEVLSKEVEDYINAYDIHINTITVGEGPDQIDFLYCIKTTEK